jgi:hypothetical protein
MAYIEHDFPIEGLNKIAQKGAVGWRCPPGAASQGQSHLKAPHLLRPPAAVMVREAGRRAFCPERPDGPIEHRSSGVVFSARDLQRDEQGKATCLNRAGGFLVLSNEPKPGILYLVLLLGWITIHGDAGGASMPVTN